MINLNICLLETSYSFNFSNIAPKSKHKKRKRPYYVPVNGLVRIVKRDIRRDYATMLINVYNSGDEAFVEKFLNQICIPNCQTVRFSYLSGKFNKPCRKYSDGIKTMIAQMKEVFDSFSDFTIKLQNAHIYRRSDMIGSKVIMDTEMQFSEMFTNEIPFIPPPNLPEAWKLMSNHDQLLHYYYDQNPISIRCGQATATVANGGMNYGTLLIPWIATDTDQQMNHSHIFDINSSPMGSGYTTAHSSSSNLSSLGEEHGNTSVSSAEATTTATNKGIVDDILHDITAIKTQRMRLQPCFLCQAAQRRLLHTPAPVYAKVRITMCLDEDHRMYRLEVIPTLSTLVQ